MVASPTWKQSVVFTSMREFPVKEQSRHFMKIITIVDSLQPRNRLVPWSRDAFRGRQRDLRILNTQAYRASIRKA